MNAIYLRRRLKVIVPEGRDEVSTPILAAFQKNISSLGFVLSPEVCDRLARLSLDDLVAFYNELIPVLKKILGCDRVFQPMYPNFPQQVMEMSAAKLYFNAMVHYCTNLLWRTSVRERLPLSDKTELKVIHLGSRADFENIFTLLVSAKTSISQQDRLDVAWFAGHYRDDLFRLLPSTLPSKENLATVGAELIKSTTNGREWLGDQVKTATDILRIAVSMSGGDVSLATVTKFTKFPRNQRALLLSWLEKCENATEDMLRWKGPWIRLGERLHPGEYQSRFPRTFAAFDVLRNDRDFETFNSTVEKKLAAGDCEAVVSLLQMRPGELARRLDHLLRLAKHPSPILEAFQRNAAKVTTPVLLQTMTHFTRRPGVGSLRTFFPKGSVAKVQAIENNLPPLPPGVDKDVVEICESTLIKKFSSLPSLGKCYLDGRLTDYLVPFSQRSAAKSLRTLVRGSRLAMPECRVLRFFIWWRNGASRTDIDLSAALYDSDLKYVDVVSYYNLKNFGGCHSGDIVDAPQGAAEFIDIDVTLTKAAGVRYIVMSLNSFTNQPFCDLPECFAGWMARQAPNSGEIFEPRTVQDKVDIASNTRTCLPAVFDLVENRVLWMDIALGGSPCWNNVENNLSGVSLMLRAMLNLNKTTLHSLFDLHIKARGERTEDISAADSVFSINDGITPFDLDRIAAEYL